MRRLLRALTAVALLGLPAAATPQDHVIRPGTLEGRPRAIAASPLQAVVDAAVAGARIVVRAGTYRGDFVIDKPIALIGEGRPLLVGSGEGSVIRVRADDVTIEGFDIDGRRGGDLGRDSSGIHVAARRAVVRDCRIVDALFGVYLREADGATVERCDIRGIPNREPGEKGSGIHAYNTSGFRFVDNRLTDVRDALYLQNSSRGLIRGNRAKDMRYGLHYMFSDDNVFEENTFENGDAGTAVMYSRRIVFRRNRFVHNRGFASVGLLLQQCDDVTAEDNLIADNARGIFLEGTHRTLIQRNLVAQSDTAIVMFDSASEAQFRGNAFVGSLSPLTLVGRRTDAVFEGNYWSENHEPDLDGDGRSDRPFALTSVFDHFRGNLTAADLFSDGFAAAALGTAERAFPVLEAARVSDRAPLARMPDLSGLPAPEPGEERGSRAAVAAAAAAIALGATGLARGRRASWVRPGARP